jgi:hypothetical protein
MIQSRFFHSSLKEIELNINEIYSLQSELRSKVLATANNPAKKILAQQTNFEALNSYESSSASSESSKNDFLDLANVETKNYVEELTKNNFISIDEKFYQNNTIQTNSIFIKSDSEFKSNLNEIHLGDTSSQEYLKEHKEINPTFAIVSKIVICEVCAIMFFLFFIL